MLSLFKTSEKQGKLSDKKEQKVVSIDEKTGYEDVAARNLLSLIFSADNDLNKVIQEAQKRVEKHELHDFEIINMIKRISKPEILIGKGKVFEFKVDNPVMRNMFFGELISRFGTSSYYYSGSPEYYNSHFRSFIDRLGQIKGRIGQYPKIEDEIMQEFVLAQVTEVCNHSHMIDAIAQYFFKMPYLVCQFSSPNDSGALDYRLVQKSLANRYEIILEEQSQTAKNGAEPDSTRSHRFKK